MGGKTKTKTVRTPYDEAAVKSANSALSGAYGQANNTIQQWSPALNNAMGMVNANILKPPQFQTDAQHQLDKTINGDYINSNPYTGGIADLIAGKTQGNYNASFGAAGRSHGGLAALLSGQGVGDALGSFYSGVYDQERGRQQQAMMAEPAFNADQYTAPNELASLVNNTTMLPLNAANAYGQGVTTVNSPYTTDTTTQKQTIGLGQILGMAAQLGSAFIPGAGVLGGGGGLAGLLGGGGAALGSVGAIPGMTGAINNIPKYLG